MSSSSALCSCLSSGSSVTSTHRRRRASSSSSLTSSSSSSSFPSSRRGFSPPSVYLNKNKNKNNINNKNNNTSSSSGRRRSSSSSSKLKVCAAMSSIDDPNFADLSDRLKLDNVRQSLIRQEDSIIFALIERSQYKVNDKIERTRTDGWENSKVHFAGRTRVLPGKFTTVGYTTDELWGGFARMRVEN